MLKLKAETVKYCRACGKQMERDSECDEFDSNTGQRRYIYYTCTPSRDSHHATFLIDLKTGKTAPGWEE